MGRPVPVEGVAKEAHVTWWAWLLIGLGAGFAGFLVGKIVGAF